MKTLQLVTICICAVLFTALQVQAQNCVNGRCNLQTTSVVRSVPQFSEPVPSFTQPVRTVVREVVIEPTQSVVQYFQEQQPVRSLGVAAAKTSQQVAQGVLRHVGGSMGGGRYEGVGFSTSSPEAALRKCCFYGQRQMIDHSIQYGFNRKYGVYGWFATAIYN